MRRCESQAGEHQQDRQRQHVDEQMRAVEQDPASVGGGASAIDVQQQRWLRRGRRWRHASAVESQQAESARAAGRMAAARMNDQTLGKSVASPAGGRPVS